MATLKEIRRRIVSVENTKKITRAMKLMSAAKFARANTAVVAARPYGQAFDAMLSRLVAMAGDEVDSPLLAVRPEKKALIVVLGSDRGFCGSLNSNLFKATLNFIAQKRKEGVELEMLAWGKRPRLFTAKLPQYKTHSHRDKVQDKPNYELAKELAAEVVQRYTEGSYDRVYVTFVEFKSALSQQPKVLQLLPIGRAEGAATAKAEDKNIIVEPDLKTLLDGLLKRAVASAVFRSILEGAASEHGARMTAMDSATNNASEVLRRLKIERNRARQAAITKELIEITSGAQAL